VIYIDSSVLLSDLLAEARSPPAALWDEEDLASSRLLAYEVWNRINAHGLMVPLRVRASGLLARVSFTEMSEQVLARALEPFPVVVRTLDALHLATMEFLRSEGEPVELASYDNRLIAAARTLGIAFATL
jgi:predicted nucleic acid-binding protein